MSNLEWGNNVSEVTIWEERENNGHLWGFHYKLLSFSENTVVAYCTPWWNARELKNSEEVEIPMASWLRFERVQKEQANKLWAKISPLLAGMMKRVQVSTNVQL